VTLLVWGRTVSFEFVWDDRQFVQELQSIRSLKHIPEMFYSLAAQSSFPEGFKLFRPLRTVQYAVLYFLGGQAEPQPWLFHLVNVLWHAGAAMLLYSVALTLFGRGCAQYPAVARAFALLTALAFAAHPVVSEVVCWVKSLDDIMATVFTLAATRALLRWPEDRKAYVWALIWFLLAVYSKESAVPFAAVAFVIFYRLHQVGWRRSCRLTMGFMAVAAVFVVHRHLVIGRSSQTAPISGSYGQTLLDMFPVVPKYLRLLGGVPPFRIDYSFLHGHEMWVSPEVLVGLVLVALAVVLAGWLWRWPQGAVPALGLCWFGLFLLPVSNLIPMMQYMAERFLYLPLIGALIGLGALVLRLPRHRFSAALYALIILVWSGLAWNRSDIWKDELTLFVQSSLERPRTPRVEENAVAAIFNLPHMRAAFLPADPIRKVRVVRTPLPPRLDAVFNTLTEARRLFPDNENVLTALAILYAKTGQYPLAIGLFDAATRQSPTNSMYWTDLGQACVEAHQWIKAGTALTNALALETNNVEAWRASSSLFWQERDYPAALAAFKRLQQLEPGNAEHDYWIRRVEENLRAAPPPAPR
jgi:tetratricopeptide (TPR) repeat protein